MQSSYQGHYGGPRIQQPAAARSVHPGVLIGVTVWRLVIVAFALIGVLAALETLTNPWPGLSLQASVFTAVVYGALVLWPLVALGRSHEPPWSSWLRGGTAVLMLLVCAVYMTMMGGDISETWSLFEHVLTPLVVFIDAGFVGASVARRKWWHPFSWVLIPLLYLIYYNIKGLRMYGGMLRPDNADFVMYVAALLATTIVLGFLVYGLGKLRGAMSGATPAGDRYEPPPPMGPQPGGYPAPHSGAQYPGGYPMPHQPGYPMQPPGGYPMQPRPGGYPMQQPVGYRVPPQQWGPGPDHHAQQDFGAADAPSSDASEASD